jgi:ParB family transcriptional regulator, chromosome partitioning protein
MTTQGQDSKQPRRLGRGLSSLMGITQPVVVDVSNNKHIQPAVASSAPAMVATPRTQESFSASDALTSTAAGAGGESVPSVAGVVMLELVAISPSPFQPRRSMNELALAQLADSIRRSGLMQPIIVRPEPRRGGEGEGNAPRYELIAGERRWRAAAKAGLAQVPALIRELDDETAAEWSLVENVQREDLNAMDRAFALRSLMQRFALTQDQLAERVGLERSSVSNLIRLTELEGEVADLIASGALGAGHGKALLSFPAGPARVETARLAARVGMSVRRLEQLAQDAREQRTTTTISGGGESSSRAAVLRDLERQIGQQLGTKVLIVADRQGKKGRLIVEFYGIDHFDGLLTKMGVKQSM